MAKAFIPKDNQNLPDSYTIEVLYVTGKTDKIEVAHHSLLDKTIIPIDSKVSRYEPSASPFLEYVTKDDIWGWIPISSILRLEFDKNFSKIMAERQKKPTA